MRTKEQAALVKRVFALKNEPHNLSETVIAARLQISFSALQRWKCGMNSPSMETFFRVRSYLDKLDEKVKLVAEEKPVKKKEKVSK